MKTISLETAVTALLNTGVTIEDLTKEYNTQSEKQAAVRAALLNTMDVVRTNYPAYEEYILDVVYDVADKLNIRVEGVNS